MRRQAGALVIAVATASLLSAVRAGPVLAECTFVPPWPDITRAIPAARTIVVGSIVTEFPQEALHLAPDQIPRDYALLVTNVLRGDMTPGDLIDVQYLLPNWPWTQSFAGDQPYPSCSSLPTSPGEVIALALDALYPGGTIDGPDGPWIQPPTRYHAMGVIEAGPLGDNWPEREQVTLAQLEALASLPMTDTVEAVERSVNWPIASLVAGIVGFLLALKWTPRRKTG